MRGTEVVSNIQSGAPVDAQILMRFFRTGIGGQRSGLDVIIEAVLSDSLGPSASKKLEQMLAREAAGEERRRKFAPALARRLRDTKLDQAAAKPGALAAVRQALPEDLRPDFDEAWFEPVKQDLQRTSTALRAFTGGDAAPALSANLAARIIEAAVNAALRSGALADQGAAEALKPGILTGLKRRNVEEASAAALVTAVCAAAFSADPDVHEAVKATLEEETGEAGAWCAAADSLLIQ